MRNFMPFDRRVLSRGILVFGVVLSVMAEFDDCARADLVGHWTFDGDFSNSGTAGAALNGTAVGDAQIALNISDGSTTRSSVLSLDGTGDEVTITDNVTNLHSAVPFTIAAWVKTTDTGQAILSKDNGSFAEGTKHFFLNADVSPGGFGYVGRSQEWIRTSSTVNDGLWHHVAVSNNPSHWQRVYIDGVDVTTADNFFGDFDTGNILRIGNSPWSKAGFFTGYIDDVRIYNEALDTNAIASLAVAEIPEPSALALAALGLLGLLGLGWRRRR